MRYLKHDQQAACQLKIKQQKPFGYETEGLLQAHYSFKESAT